jgi:hypothetical protein
MALLRRLVSRPSFQAGACATIAFAAYVRTLAPTVMWYDMGEFATAASALGIAHNTGYPLFVLLGKLFTFLPLGDPAYRVNLLSAVFGALTVALTFLILSRLTSSSIAAWAGALTIAFSSTLWSNATWAISYDLNAFLTLLVFLLLLRWWEAGEAKNLLGALFVFGLGFGNHRLIAVMALPIAYLIWRQMSAEPERRTPRAFVAMAAAFLTGLSINLYLPLRAAMEPAYMWADASNVPTFLRMVTTGAARSSVFVNPFRSIPDLHVWWTVLTRYPVYELTVPGLLLAALGGWELARRRGRIFACTLMVVGTALVMVSVYGIHNIYNYFQPIYLVAAVWIGCGIHWIEDHARARLESIDSGLGSGRLPQLGIVLIVCLSLLMPTYLARRNYARLNRSAHRDARDFARFALAKAGPDGILLADFWSWAPMKYLQLVEGMGTDVTVLPAISDPGLDQIQFLDGLLKAGAPVYVAVSAEESPRLEIPRDQLQLVAPYVIQSFTTPSRPLPEFKDLLVPQGMLYRAVTSPPNLSVEAVPGAAQREVQFEGGLRLRGFAFDPSTVKVGDSFQVRYYWQIDSKVEHDYWVDVLFTDAQGNAVTRGGFPIWLHSHWLGGGPFRTSQWSPGVIYREQYDGLVPRAVQPGEYQVRIVLYRGGIREEPVRVLRPVAPATSVSIATITVIEP